MENYHRTEYPSAMEMLVDLVFIVTTVWEMARC